MKYGFRQPSFKKSISARTKGRFTRAEKKAFNPMYGKKGMGWLNGPKKAAYNAAYHRTTRSVNPTNVHSKGHRNSNNGFCLVIAYLIILFTIPTFLVGWIGGKVALFFIIFAIVMIWDNC